MMAGTPRAAWSLFIKNKPPASSGFDAIKLLEQHMFAQQLAVHRDPSKRRAVLTTRRAGKTDCAAARRLICMAKHPGENSWSGYVTLTKGQSRRNLEGPLRTLIRQFNLPVRQAEYDGQITFTHANGHRLWVGGVDDMRKAERWRGNKWWEFDIDEGGAWPDDVLSYMIDDIIDPGLSDTNGTLTINGTPGVLARGFFYEVTTPGNRLPDGREKRPQWSTHTWSVLDNPHHRFGQPGGLAELDAMREARGWSHDHPTWLREWRGMWASDPDLLIYRYDGKRNATYEMPTGKLQFVLGVDVGHDDDTAFVLTVSRFGFPHVHVLRAWGANAMTQPQRAQEVLRIQTALKRTHGSEAIVVVDTGGLGKALAYDLTRTYGVACKPAEKRDKAAAIRAVQGALESGWLLVSPFAPNPDDPIGMGASQLLAEWSVLPWNDDRTGHHDGYSDHCADALLYAYREHPSYERWDENQPPAGTPEARDLDTEREIERRMLEGAIRNQVARGRGNWLSVRDEMRRIGR